MGPELLEARLPFLLNNYLIHHLPDHSTTVIKMSTSNGIQTYTSAPLNSNQEEEKGTHASTVRPEPATTIESATTTSQPATTSATATSPAYSPIYATTQPKNPSAQPGATPSLPAPTASTVSQPGNLSATPTTTLPTATTATSAFSPAGPQPGAVPQPRAAAAQSPVPPPPKAGEAVSASLPFTAPATGAPQPSTQFRQSYAYQPHSQTPTPNFTSTPYSSVYPTPSSGGGTSQPQTLPLHYGGAGGGSSSIFHEDEEPGMLNTAKAWMQTAGTKLAEVEAEVWKRINNAHDDEK